MKVAHVFVTPVSSGNYFKGYANIKFRLRDNGEGCLLIQGFKIFEKEGQIWASMPSEKDKEGEWRDRISINKEDPDGKELSENINTEVAKAYRAKISQSGQPSSEGKKTTTKPVMPF